MLRALGERLRILASDPKNNFSSKIRRLTGPREAARYGQPLRRMILAMPQMIAQLHRWSDTSGLPPRLMRMQRFTLSYLYDPIDFLSSKNSGLFRYLDDAYLISRIFQITLAKNDASGSKNRSTHRALAQNIPEWIAIARLLLPHETAQMEDLIAEAGRAKPRTRKKTK